MLVPSGSEVLIESDGNVCDLCVIEGRCGKVCAARSGTDVPWLNSVGSEGEVFEEVKVGAVGGARRSCVEKN